MALLETLIYTPSRLENAESAVWVRSDYGRIAQLPQIFWSDGSSWREANAWLGELAANKANDIKTVHSKAAALLNYAKWLEVSKNSWMQVHGRKDERCINKFRGALILARQEGSYSASTVSSRIRVIRQFYSWIVKNNLVTLSTPLWRERRISIQFTDRYGFAKSKDVITTDLAIPLRSRKNIDLEDGLWPVSTEDREKILNCARDNAPLEIYYMLLLGFHTGMRIQSIGDIKAQTIARAIVHPLQDGISTIAIGPGADPSVATKYGKTGRIEIPTSLVQQLRVYSLSEERLLRSTRAQHQDQDILFITKAGNRYTRADRNTSGAINTAMCELRKIGKRLGINALIDFKFHQSRATYATEYATFALSIDPVSAIEMVRRNLLHKDEATTMKYIKFIKQHPLISEINNKFTKRFLGRYHADHA
ncbi:Site-specific recombinase XerD [Pseudomonas sp. NFR02]|uniref:tyrosine-type recombinase/integrase n=1 Tax=Pseudomonas sp. NFR02 TaxID=1566229 RepID=UPI000911B239|nr:site-specific integrase [Pseudomonas sp. NFR02]SFY21963.1 Site-specific recombinase XerD [Pseudomonas sp. NFR02]